MIQEQIKDGLKDVINSLGNEVQHLLVQQLKEIKQLCDDNGFDYSILSQHLMTEEEYTEWYSNELSKYESQKEYYESEWPY